jgi:hypothetical protein
MEMSSACAYLKINNAPAPAFSCNPRTGSVTPAAYQDTRRRKIHRCVLLATAGQRALGESLLVLLKESLMTTSSKGRKAHQGLSLDKYFWVPAAFLRRIISIIQHVKGQMLCKGL